MSTPPIPTPPGSRFDPNTGAPIQQVPPPKQNVFLWILAAIGILFVCMMFAGLMILRALRGTNLNIARNGQGVEISVPGGMKIRAGETAITGLPVYPGASSEGKGGGVEITSADGTQSGVSGANYTTQRFDGESRRVVSRATGQRFFARRAWADVADGERHDGAHRIGRNCLYFAERAGDYDCVVEARIRRRHED